jgi:hypothetical protein
VEHHLTDTDLARLEPLREQYLAGLWPRAIDEPFSTRHMITMQTSLVREYAGEVIYECVLTRLTADGVERHLITHVRTPDSDSERPSVDEVLRLNAVRAVNPEARSARQAIPDQGTDDPTSVDSLRASARFRLFLGQIAFAELCSLYVLHDARSGTSPMSSGSDAQGT